MIRIHFIKINTEQFIAKSDQTILEIIFKSLFQKTLDFRLGIRHFQFQSFLKTNMENSVTHFQTFLIELSEIFREELFYRIFKK